MSMTVHDPIATAAFPSSADTRSAESLEMLAEHSHHFVSQIYSDAKLLVQEFNRDFTQRTDKPNVDAVSVEAHPGLLRLVTHLRPQIGFELRLEVEYKRNPAQLIRTLRQMNPDRSTGPLVLCDAFHFATTDGTVILTRPDTSVMSASAAAEAILEPLFNRITDAIS
ncbi:MAG: hypothetical protein ACREDR_04405 [Blastocatellia bacterium]